MQKLWKVDTTSWEVREVDGTAWPDNDSEGDKIYDNTHFKIADDAWRNLMRNAEAAVTMGADEVVRARRHLREAEQRAAQDAVNYAKAKAGFELHCQPNTADKPRAERTSA